MGDEDRLPAYLLAGGRSRRFGTDKALVAVDGRPQLLQLIDQLSHDEAGRLRPVHIVADAPDRYQQLGLDCLVDTIPGGGPVAGLATALDHRIEHYGPGWLLLVPCDQLLWDPTWEAALKSGRRPTVGGVLFGAQPSPHNPPSPHRMNAPPSAWSADAKKFHPLPGLYHTRLRPTVAARLHASSCGSLQSLVDDSSCAIVPTTTLPDQLSFNNQQELAALRHRRT
ncbi:MAG: hypothetical protein KatS3mg111_1519 [Pirellulaceae bacterium]|nr:MAG: hypothetical protein KatS3mg111_1519 [Pirellulaceae bacterium]